MIMTISREELAEVVWGDEADEKYSEWAIDKRISRLRKNLKDLGFLTSSEFI